jgi:hypothetical protein
MSARRTSVLSGFGTCGRAAALARRVHTVDRQGYSQSPLLPPLPQLLGVAGLVLDADIAEASRELAVPNIVSGRA